jgi:hypothetical protein
VLDRSIVADEGRPQGEQLVEHDAERVEVRANVDGGLAAELLRRHVHGGAHDRAGAGKAFQVRRGEPPGEAEIEDRGPDLPGSERGPGEEDVLGLEIAVDHARGVGGGERDEDRVAGGAGGERGEGGFLRGEARGERAAGELLQDEVRAAVVEASARVKGGHVGRADALERVGLVAEARMEDGVVPAADLDRSGGGVLEAPRRPDDGEAAFAEPLAEREARGRGRLPVVEVVLVRGEVRGRR